MKQPFRILAPALAACLFLPLFAGCAKGAGSILQDKALYEIISVDNGRVMAADQFDMLDGAYVELEAFSGDLNQVWRALKQPDGSFALENLSTSRYLTLKDDSQDDDVAAGVAARDTADALQGWNITYAGGGNTFRIESPGSGKYLQSSGRERSIGTKIVQMGKAGGSAQKWEFKKLDDGTRNLPVMLRTSGSVEHSSTPVIERVGDTYYLFAMQDGVSVKTSKDLRVWTKQENALSTIGDLPFSWMESKVPGGGIWAPDIHKFGNTYYLYYCLSTTGKQTSAIGLCTNTTLDESDPNYAWADKGAVISSTTADDFNAIDPSVAVDDGGQPWLVYGSWWTGIKMQKLDANTGLLAADATVVSIASRADTDRGIEAPHIVKHGEYYYLFCAVGPMDEKYHCIVGRSKSITGPYVDKSGVSLMQSGGTDFSTGKEGVEKPGHGSIFLDSDGTYYFVTEYFQSGSNSLLGISTLLWDEDGWPVSALTPGLFAKTDGGS